LTAPVTPEPQSTTAGITRPFVVAVWTYAASYLPRIAAFFGGYVPAWAMPALGVVAGAIGYRLVFVEWNPREFDPKLASHGRILAMVSGAAMAGWLYYAAVLAPVPAATLLAFLTLPLGGWYWSLHRSAVRRTAAVVAAATGPNAMVYRPPNTWEQIFEDAGLTGVTVHETETAAGVTLTVRPHPDYPWKTSEIADKSDAIVYRLSFARPEIELREDDIRVEPGETLPRTLVHISWKRPLRATIPYVSAGPASIVEPAGLGIDEIGNPVAVKLAGQNAKTVSATDGGKTVVTNVTIARITETTDAIVWVAATEKLLPLVYPWLRPWLAGRTDDPVLDGVAGEDARDVGDMLADLYLLVKMRNARNTRRSKHAPSVERPAVIVIIEEAAAIANYSGKIKTYDGVKWRAAALFERICAIDRSASVGVYFLNQSALDDALGTDIDRHINMRIAGRTNSSYDGQATLPALKGNVDTTRLRDNTLLLQPHREVPRTIPWKSFYLEDDELIEPVAIRNAQWRPTLEKEFTEHPALRWHPYRWDDGRLPDLFRESSSEGFEWPGTYGTPVRTDDDDDDDGYGGADMAAMTDADVEAIGRDVDKTVAAIESLTADYLPLPDPFDSIESALRASNAPTDWVSTAQLAMVLDRVAPDADPAEVDKAAWTLGRELSALVPNLRSTGPRNVGEGRKRNGYSVPRLLAACAALRAGKSLPADDAEEATTA
jgi:hypothetical protein